MPRRRSTFEGSEKSLDAPRDIFADREALFEFLESKINQEKEHQYDTIGFVIRKIFQQSIPDAIDLAERLGWRGIKLLETALTENTKEVKQKHGKFLDTFKSVLKADGLAADPIEQSTVSSPLPEAITTSIENAITAHYAQQLASKKFREISALTADTRSTGEKLAVNIIAKYAEAYAHTVGINQVNLMLRNLLADRIGPTDSPEEADGRTAMYLQEIIDPRNLMLLLQETISPEEMLAILWNLQITEQQRKEFMKEFELHRIRPLEPVIQAGQIGAREGITKDVKASLKARGIPDSAYEIVYDAPMKRVEVKWKEGEEVKEKKPDFEIKNFPPAHNNFQVHQSCEFGWQQIIGLSDGTNQWLVHTASEDKVLPFKGRLVFASRNKPYLLYQDPQGRLVYFDADRETQGAQLVDPDSISVTKEVSGEDGRVRFLHLTASLKSGVTNFLYDTETNTFAEFDNLEVIAAHGDGCYMSSGGSFGLLRIKDGVLTPEEPGRHIDKKSGELVDVIQIGDDVCTVQAMASGLTIEIASLSLYLEDETYFDHEIVDGNPVIITHNEDRYMFRMINVRNQSFTTQKVAITDAHPPYWSCRIIGGDFEVFVSDPNAQKTTQYFEGVDISAEYEDPQTMVSGKTTVSLQGRQDYTRLIRRVGYNYEGESKIPHEPGHAYFFLKKIGTSILVISRHTDGTNRLVRVINFNDDGSAAPVKSQLTSEEAQKLDILNAALNPTRDRIEEMHFLTSPEPPQLLGVAQMRMQQKLGRSAAFVHSIQDLVRSAVNNMPLAKHLFKTIAVQPAGADRVLAERLMLTLYPFVASMRAQRKASRRHGNKTPLFAPPEVYLRPGLEGVLMGGDPQPDAPGSQKEVASFRHPVHGFLARQILSDYNPETNRWSSPRHNFRMKIDLAEPIHETTGTILAQGGKQQLLPILPGAELIPQRVKAVDANGNDISTLEIKFMAGIPYVETPRGAKKIVFSFRYSSVPGVPRDVTQKEYDRLKKSWLAARAEASGDKTEHVIGQLPPECRHFIHSIESLPPLERVKRIENFVREHSYYDFNNGDVINAKVGKKPTDLFMIMRGRMSELKRAKPEFAQPLKTKIFAGVCSDFAVLVAAMNQASGLTGGVMRGLNAGGTSVTVGQAHDVAWVAWPPSADGEYTTIAVDGTPEGVTVEEQKLLEGIRLASVEEREAAQETALDDYNQEHAQEFQNIIRALEGKDSDEIKKLTNGKIEQAVNAVLTQDTKSRDAHVLKHVLNVLLYSPVSLERLDWSDVVARAQVLGFVDSELTRERSLHVAFDSKKSPGAQLMEGFLVFLDKYKRRYPASQPQEALELLTHVFDGIAGHLDPVERRVATVVITYLNAKKMVA